jgi:hypothetical protein
MPFPLFVTQCDGMSRERPQLITIRSRYGLSGDRRRAELRVDAVSELFRAAVASLRFGLRRVRHECVCVGARAYA